MPAGDYQPPEGYLTLSQVQQQLEVSAPTLRRMIRTADVEIYEDPRDTRVKLLRVEDVPRLVQPRKKAA